MRQRWMRIIESGPDRDIGAALVRLAQKAAEAHRAELAAPAQRHADDAPGALDPFETVEPDANANASVDIDPDPHRTNREPER